LNIPTRCVKPMCYTSFYSQPVSYAAHRAKDASQWQPGSLAAWPLTAGRLGGNFNWLRVHWLPAWDNGWPSHLTLMWHCLSLRCT